MSEICLLTYFVKEMMIEQPVLSCCHVSEPDESCCVRMWVDYRKSAKNNLQHSLTFTTRCQISPALLFLKSAPTRTINHITQVTVLSGPEIRWKTTNWANIIHYLIHSTLSPLMHQLNALCYWLTVPSLMMEQVDHQGIMHSSSHLPTR